MSEFEGEQEYEREPAPNLRPLESSRSITIAIFILLALIGSSAAFFWHEYDSLLTFKSAAAPVVSLKAFEEYQQVVDASLQRDHESLKIQDAQLKRMSDQVLQLIMKLDLLESNVRNAQAAIPVAPKAAPKKPAEKPRISTGGAPLPPAPGSSEVQTPTNRPQ